MSRCKLTSHPLYAGMPLVGCLLLGGKKCSRPMGLNVLGGQEVRFSSTGCELNAGLIVIFRSSHPPLFDWHAWSLRFRSSPGSVTDVELKDEASNLAAAFWDRTGEFLMRTRTASELSPEEKTLWIQSGLAVSPLMGTCLQHSLDFCLAWALIGEWTSRVLFPVPKGPWPRHGHVNAVRLGLWHGHEQLLNKVPFHHC